MRIWNAFGDGIDPLERGEHGQRKVGHHLGVICPRQGYPGRGHVSIADGLDLLDLQAPAEIVKGRKDPIEVVHQDRRRDPRRRREADQIGEQDGRLLDPVGDHYLAIVQPETIWPGRILRSRVSYLCLSSSIRSTYRRSRSRQRLRSRQALMRARSRTGLNGFAR